MRKASNWLVSTCAAIMVLSACGAVEEPLESATTDGLSSGAQTLDATLDGGSDTGPAVAEDAATQDVSNSAVQDVTALDVASVDTSGASPCPGGPGCACKENADCDTAQCIDTPNGQQCAQSCVETCPEGFKCAAVSTGGGDATNICVPRFGKLCDPCASSKDCKSLGLVETACVDQGKLGSFCAVGCKATDQCPAGFGCKDVLTAEGTMSKQCVKSPAKGSDEAFGTCECSKRATDQQLVTSCYNEVKDAAGKLVGKCMGTKACLTAGLGECTGLASSTEVCDGKDNDCDGSTDEATCNDANPCTTDSCDPAKAASGGDGCNHDPQTATPCNADDSVCTDKDSCQSGVCKPGALLGCDDSNPCTKDSCDLAKGCTQTHFNGLPCDADGSACTVADVCANGVCNAGKTVVCNDGKTCTDDSCDSKTGKCVTKPVAQGASCNDGSKCTEADGCIDGQCKGKALDCDDANPCTTDVCDPAKGCQYADSSSPCSDGNACTVGDTCEAGKCTAGTTKSCKSATVCSVGQCDQQTGKCAYKAAAEATPCDDASKCTTDDACSKGWCQGKVISCDDGNVCTDDNCGSKTGCTHVANTTPCNDNNACSQGDKCANSACAGLPLDVSLTCDDANPCTTDACAPKSGCTHVANKATCSDGNPCTVGDQCAAKSCKPGPSTCACQADSDCTNKEDGDLCNGTLFCDKSKLPFKCQVNPKTIVSCPVDKNGLCAKSKCTAKTGKCAMVPLAEGKPCDADGNVCSAADTCKSGKCTAGKQLVCNDTNPCTTDACDPKKGCTTTANANPCDADGNKCTVSDRCKGKVCVAGATNKCNDANPCTVDSCQPKTGKCLFDGAPVDGKPCDADGSVCTVSDRCKAGKCTAGNALKCDDGNNCTGDVCKPQSGCAHIAINKPCNADDSACTVADSCKSKSCVAGPAKKCDDGKGCTVDSCDAKTGKCVFNPAPLNGKACDADGSVCTVSDTCKAGACIAGNKFKCDDGNTCTTNPCDKVKGCLTLQRTGSCEDGNKCTVNDSCAKGKCVGKARVCDDNNVCTDDSCQALTGCAHKANTKPCPDADKCTEKEVCKAKKCTTQKVNCDDNNPCTKDTCSSAKGCGHTTLSDKTSCGTGKWCVSAKCVMKAFCGDGKINQSGEKCDGSAVDGKSCADFLGKGATGTLKCKKGCDGFDSSGCNSALGTAVNPASSCKQILSAKASKGSGVYHLKVSGKTYKVYCDMTTSGGGWLLASSWDCSRTGSNWGSFYSGAAKPGPKTKHAVPFAALMPKPTQYRMMRPDNGQGFSGSLTGGWQTNGNRIKIRSSGNDYLIYGDYCGDMGFCVVRPNHSSNYNCDGNGGQVNGRGQFNSCTSDEFCNCGGRGWKVSAGGCNATQCGYCGLVAIYLR